ASQPLFTNEEIDSCLARRGDDTLLAAEFALVSLMAVIAQSPEETVGPASRSNSQVYANLEKQLLEVRRQIVVEGGFMYIGGLSPIQARFDQCTTKRPVFTKEMLEPYPCAAQRSSLFGPGWSDPLLGE